MDVRVWSVVEERLIEVRAELVADGPGLRIEGLPSHRTRTTRDRLQAALVNSGLLQEAPSTSLCLVPPIRSGPTSDLDLPLALAVLARAGAIGTGFRWILAEGRLGVDGTAIFWMNLSRS